MIHNQLYIELHDVQGDTLKLHINKNVKSSFRQKC